MTLRAQELQEMHYRDGSRHTWAAWLTTLILASATLTDASIAHAWGSGLHHGIRRAAEADSGGTRRNLAVYAGYYDTHHSNGERPKPDPWQDSPNVQFVGVADSAGVGWDTSALRFDNLTADTLFNVSVTVQIGFRFYELWDPSTIAPHQTLILTQTAAQNFDGSDSNPAGCYTCDPGDCATRQSRDVPVVRIVMNNVATSYYDEGQILNTHGVDAAGCPYNGVRNDESELWQQVFDAATLATAGVPAAAATLDAREPTLEPPSPSPTRGPLAIRFRTESRGLVRLRVHDVQGRLVRTLIEDVLESGEHTQTLTLTGVPAGVYYCTLWTPQASKRRAFTLVR